MIIYNQSNVTFKFDLPGGGTQEGDVDSNVVETEVLTYSVTKVKSSDKTFLQEGETARQTVVITNNSKADLFNLIFKDTMTDGATYVAGSVTVNGVSQPTYDPAAGFPLPDLDEGEAVTIQYTIRANDPLTETNVENYGTLTYSLDVPGQSVVTFTENTNTVVITLISNRLTVVKSVDKAVAVKGDTLHYTSVITNAGTTEKTDLVFTDPIPADTTFVPFSVKVNGVVIATHNPQTGFDLPDLDPGESVTVEFDVTVN